jgi:Family of unknown function (DUF6151)
MAHAPLDLALRCRCGQVRGVASEVSPDAGFRFVCYCKDCQAFARFLGRADVLDAAGGTDIFQLPPARIKLTAGADGLRCLCFSRSVLRWYTECCRTPVANSAAAPRFPVAGLIHSFVDPDADARFRDAALGPASCRIFARSAVAPLPPTAPPPASVGLFFRRARLLVGWWMRGLARPNPFFDDVASAPLSPPRLLTESERAAL